jgi:hypothetical protein
VLLYQDYQKGTKGLYELLMQLPHDYTIMGGTNWRWGNTVTALLLTQRSLLLGLPLALIIFTQWWRALAAADEKVDGGEQVEKRKKKGGKRKGQKLAAPLMRPARLSRALTAPETRMIAAGLMTGTLVLVHAHTFVVVMGVSGCLALLFRKWRAWAYFFAASLAVALPQLLWVTRNSPVQATSFFGWQFGWHREPGAGEENTVWFWFKNTGLFIPLLIASLLWRGGVKNETKRSNDQDGAGTKGGGLRSERLVSWPLLLFFLPFTLCFVIPNLVRLAPWVWDNIKVLFYWYVAAVPLVALLLARLLRDARPVVRGAGVVLVITLTLAGALDVWRVVSKAEEYGEFDRDGVAFAQVIERETAPRSLVLHAPIHNDPVFLTGRRSLMGYPGHIWTHGLEYAQREQEIRRIYAGSADADALLKKLGVEYVVVSPLEKYVMPVSDAFFARYAKVGEVGEYRLYKIPRP